jgi:hypothetical protein
LVRKSMRFRFMRAQNAEKSCLFLRTLARTACYWRMASSSGAYLARRSILVVLYAFREGETVIPSAMRTSHGHHPVFDDVESGLVDLDAAIDNAG